MLERDLQDYLFENPDVLFPGQAINRKRREAFVEGRRIDLLFEADRVQYIVELKRDTIRREDIGQIFEYYGLMRKSNETAHYKMILVAPAIPAYRRIPLEEFGIRCVEVPHRPESIQERAELVSDAIGYLRHSSSLIGFDHFRLNGFGATRTSLYCYVRCRRQRKYTVDECADPV